MHLVYPKILHNHCFQIIQCITVVPREIENNGYAKFFVVVVGGGGVNRVHYGVCENGEYFACS